MPSTSRDQIRLCSEFLKHPPSQYPAVSERMLQTIRDLAITAPGTQGSQGHAVPSDGAPRTSTRCAGPQSLDAPGERNRYHLAIGWDSSVCAILLPQPLLRSTSISCVQRLIPGGYRGSALLPILSPRASNPTSVFFPVRACMRPYPAPPSPFPSRFNGLNYASRKAAMSPLCPTLDTASGRSVRNPRRAVGEWRGIWISGLHPIAAA